MAILSKPALYENILQANVTMLLYLTHCKLPFYNQMDFNTNSRHQIEISLEIIKTIFYNGNFIDLMLPIKILPNVLVKLGIATYTTTICVFRLSELR